jgi:hypothetical protein
MRVIILAAGQAFLLDGMVKCLVRSPHDGRPLLAHAIEAFAGHRLTVVVGYRAVAVMEAYPDLDYVYNPDWATTNNSYSLGLALDDEPCYVMSGDLVFGPPLVRELDAAGPDLVLTERRENRIQSSVNCVVAHGAVRECYVGPLRDPVRPGGGRPVQGLRPGAPAAVETQLSPARQPLRRPEPAGRRRGPGGPRPRSRLPSLL